MNFTISDKAAADMHEYNWDRCEIESTIPQLFYHIENVHVYDAESHTRFACNVDGRCYYIYADGEKMQVLETDWKYLLTFRTAKGAPHCKLTFESLSAAIKYAETCNEQRYYHAVVVDRHGCTRYDSWLD
jgi:hypothetical protein